MDQVLRLVDGYDEDGRPEPRWVYECARQSRRGAMARHRRQPLDPWTAVDPDDPDARALAHAWARGWDQHERVLTAVGRGAQAAKAGESHRSCPYYPDDEDGLRLSYQWLFGWRAKGGQWDQDRRLAEVIPLRRALPDRDHTSSRR